METRVASYTALDLCISSGGCYCYTEVETRVATGGYQGPMQKMTSSYDQVCRDELPLVRIPSTVLHRPWLKVSINSATSCPGIKKDHEGPKASKPQVSLPKPARHQAPSYWQMPVL